MSVPEDRAVDPQPVALSTVVTAGNFKHEGLDWQKSGSLGGTNNPLCMCWSTGEIREVNGSTQVVESDLYFDER